MAALRAGFAPWSRLGARRALFGSEYGESVAPAPSGPVSLGALTDAAAGMGSTSNFSGSAGPPLYYIPDDPSGPKVMMFTEGCSALAMGQASGSGVEERARLIDYNTKALLGEYHVANDQTTTLNDNHTIGGGVTDRWGYHRLFYGDHATQAKGKRSAVPWLTSGTWVDIPISTTQASTGGLFTYHKPIIISGIDKIFLFMRGYTNPAVDTTLGTAFLSLMIFDIDASGNTTQNGNRIDLVDFRLAGPTLARFYSGHFAQRGTKIYIPAAWADAADAIRRDVYVFVVDVHDGTAANITISNFAESHIVAAGSFPMNLTDSKTYCRWVSQEGNGTEGTTPQICLDPINWAPALGAHVFYTEGVPASDTYQAKHRYHDGTSLQAASVISNQPVSAGAANNHCGCCGVLRADGSITAQTVTQGDFAMGTVRGGDHSRAVWTKAGGWGAPFVYIKQTEANRPWDTSVPIKDGPDDMAIATTQVTSASQAAKDGLLRVLVSGAAPRAPFIGSQYGPDVQSVSERIYDATGARPSAAYLAAAKVWNEALRDNSLWTLFEQLYVPFTNVAGATLIPWRSSRFPLTVTGSPVFTAYGGYRFVSGGYLNCPMAQNRFSNTSFAAIMAVGGLLAFTNAGSALLGTVTTAANLNFGANMQSNSGAFNFAASAGAASYAASGLDSLCLIGDKSGTTQNLFENGTLKATGTATNIAVTSELFTIGHRQATSSLATCHVVGFGPAGWDATKAGIFYSATKTFLNTVTPGTMA